MKNRLLNGLDRLSQVKRSFIFRRFPGTLFQQTVPIDETFLGIVLEERAEIVECGFVGPEVKFKEKLNISVKTSLGGVRRTKIQAVIAAVGRGGEVHLRMKIDAFAKIVVEHFGVHRPDVILPEYINRLP